MSKYALGIDFGTLSARALLVDVENGREAGTAVMDYPHGVLDEALPDGTRLPPDWALQHPNDYLECLGCIVPQALEQAGVCPCDVIGVGVDFTTCTLIPVTADGTPLCCKAGFEHEKFAYPTLWKHHAAQSQATRMTEIARARGEDFLRLRGGRVAAEWAIPKIWQALEEAPEVYARVDRYMEAGDWLVMRLTGTEARSSCLAGYKALWSKRAGYPDDAFFAALDPRLERVIDEKLSRDVRFVCTRAGVLTDEGAALTGLLPGTPVAVAHSDAHVALPAAGITGKGVMLLVLGTSGCQIVMDDAERDVPGICGVVEDGVIPGLFGYEAGQCCLGDHFGWFVDNCVPASYAREAERLGVSVHQLLTERARALKPGESGLIALDWWNGNRSVLVDADLTGLIVGLTLATKPEDIYRALIEATAYGTRVIIENFEKHGVEVKELRACGGIAQKNDLLMQIYADVLGREIRVARSAQTTALGSAMMGAVAAGAESGGYDDIADAAAHMAGVREGAYRPDTAAHAVYDALYREYVALHDLFGRGGSDVMKRLKEIRGRAHG